MIKSWSFSALQVYEKCPYAAKLKYVDRIKAPGNKYSERGVQIHAALENYVRGDTPEMSPDLTAFTPELEKIRNLYSQGRVIVEQEWAHDRKWEIVDWKADHAWLRLKLDLMVDLDAHTGLVVDWKSGKKFGNEIKHAEQGQLYAGCTFLRNPHYTKVVTEFWYGDQDDITRVEYLPKQAAAAIVKFEKRALAMTTATNFPPRPSIFTCRFCEYRKPDNYGGTGDCKHAVNNFVPPVKKQWR